MTKTLKGKKVSESRTVMTEMIMPNDTNPLGNLMGGNLMRWMDIAGGICALRHCGEYVVTASVDHVSFQSPIKLGDIIQITARVTRAFKTSLEVYIEVETTDNLGQQPHLSNSAYLTFVAMDKRSQRPTHVPPVIPSNEKEERLYEGAVRRRELRLILSGRLSVEDATEIKALFAEI